MKWVKINHNNQATYGILNGTTIKLTNHSWQDILTNKPVEIIGDVPQENTTLLNPIDRPGKIVCIGLNYLDHCRETGTPPPDIPVMFTKFTTSLNDPTGDLVWSPDFTDSVDFEAELGVIIGKNCRNIAESDALGYVAGYTAGNDVSARDIQLGDGQWVRGKSLDTFCPIGPAFVTADEIPDPQTLTIRSMLNGKVMQDSHTSEMIFTVAYLIAFCSQAFTLEAGDLILTGTPHGVGLGRDPKVYMENGDVIVVEIEKIGRLENKCRTI